MDKTTTKKPSKKLMLDFLKGYYKFNNKSRVDNISKEDLRKFISTYLSDEFIKFQEQGDNHSAPPLHDLPESQSQLLSDLISSKTTKKAYIHDVTGMDNLRHNIQQIAVALSPGSIAPFREVFGNANKGHRLLDTIERLDLRPSTSYIECVLSGKRNGVPFWPPKRMLDQLVSFSKQNLESFQLSESTDEITIKQLNIDDLVNYKIHHFVPNNPVRKTSTTTSNAIQTVNDKFCNTYIAFYAPNDSNSNAPPPPIEMMIFKIYLSNPTYQCVLIKGIRPEDKDIIYEITHKTHFKVDNTTVSALDYMTRRKTLPEIKRVLKKYDIVGSKLELIDNVYRGEVLIAPNFLSFHLASDVGHEVLSATIPIEQFRHYLYQIDEATNYLGGAGMAVASKPAPHTFPFVFVLYDYDTGSWSNTSSNGKTEDNLDNIVANQIIKLMYSVTPNTMNFSYVQEVKNFLWPQKNNVFASPEKLERIWYPLLRISADADKVQ